MSTDRPWNYTTNKGRAPYVIPKSPKHRKHKRRTSTPNPYQPPTEVIIPPLSSPDTSTQTTYSSSSPESSRPVTPVKEQMTSTSTQTDDVNRKETTSVFSQTVPEPVASKRTQTKKAKKRKEKDRACSPIPNNMTDVSTQTEPDEPEAVDNDSFQKTVNPGTDTQTANVTTQTDPEPEPVKYDDKGIPDIKIEETTNVSSSPTEPGPSIPHNKEKEPEPDNIDDTHEQELWNNMTRNGPPRMILSITGSRTQINQKQWPFENLHKAIYDTTRRCRECGLLFNKERTPEVKMMTKRLENLSEPLQSWSYSKLLEMIPDDLSIEGETGLANYNYKDKSMKEKVNEPVKCEDFIKLVKYESFVNKRRIGSNKDVLNRSPVALIVVNGDLFTLEHVARAIQKDISVTVIKGTGGAADLLATCYDSLHNLPRKVPTILGMRLNDELYSKIERVMKIIQAKHWLINTFDLENDDAHMLWKRVTNGIIRAWSIENVNVSDVDLLDGNPVFDSEGISVSKYVTEYDDVSRKEIFEGVQIDSKNHETIQDSYHQHLLFEAFKENRLEIIAVLLENNVKLKDEKLKELFDKRLQNEIKNSARVGIELEAIKITAFWKRVAKDSLETLTMSGNTAREYIKASKIIIHKLLKGSCMIRTCFNIAQSGCCCMSCCKSSVKHSDNFSRKKKDVAICENSDVLLECLITGQFDRLGIVWSNCDDPMYTALIVSRTMRALSEIAVVMAEDKWVDTFIKQEQLFSDRAIFILEKVSEEYDPDITAKALTYVSNVWGMEDSPKHFSNNFLMEAFSSHSAAHKDANTILYAARQTNTIREFINHHVFKDTSSKIFSAPLTRITIHWMFYIAALVCYGIFLTTDLRMDTISALIIAVFVFVMSDLFEEMLLLVLRVRRHCSIKMIFLHFMDIWRSMDLLFWILFLTGFFMHVSMLEDLYIHTRRVYSVALFLMFMRLLKMLLMNKILGVMVIMVKEMLNDLLKFLVVASVFMFAAGTVYHANNYPNHTYSEFQFEYWRFWQLLKIPYWQIFGELNLDTLEGSGDTNCTDNETVWVTDPTAERCSQNDWLAVFIAAVYMMLVNWLLLNIVIAMFGSQYQAVHAKSEQKWRYYRNIVVIDHEHKIPSPLNIIIRPIQIAIYIFKKGRIACTRKQKKHELSTTMKMLEKQKAFARTRIKEENQEGLNSITQRELAKLQMEQTKLLIENEKIKINFN